MALKYLYVPSAYNTGTAYGVLPNDSAADFGDFARGSYAHRVNKDGLLEEMGSNIPRIDYSDGGCPSLLLEPESRNYCRYTEDLADWNPNPSSSAVTITQNALIAPDGNKTADIISVSDIADGVYSKTLQSVAGTSYSTSMYLKHVSGSTEVRLGITTNLHSGSGEKYIVIDLSNGSIVSDTIGSLAVKKVVSVGNGWYRASLEGSVASHSGNSAISIYSGTSEPTEFSAWGGQVEIGEYTTSYIKNLDNTEFVTRSADSSYFTGELQSYMDTSEGVFEVKAKALSNGGGSESGRISFWGTSGNDRVSIVYSTTSDYLVLILKADGSDVISSSILTSFTQDETNTVKVKWKSGDIQVKVNGTVIYSNSSSFSLGGLERVSMCEAGYALDHRFEGHIYHIKVYDNIDDF